MQPNVQNRPLLAPELSSARSQRLEVMVAKENERTSQAVSVLEYQKHSLSPGNLHRLFVHYHRPIGPKVKGPGIANGSLGKRALLHDRKPSGFHILKACGIDLSL